MSKLDRRDFTRLLGGGVAAVTVLTTSKPDTALADDDLPLVDPKTPTAKALQYIAVSENENLICSGCSLYTDDGSGSKGKCTIFPKQLVPAEAWCSAYQPKV